MGIVSIGRSLLIRQVLLTALVLALGTLAYCDVGQIADVARTFATPGLAHGGAEAIATAAASAASHILIVTLVATVLMTLVSLPVMHLTIGRPIKAMATAAEQLATGDVSVTFSGETRSDEIGVMARALQRLRADAVGRADSVAMADPAAAHAQEAHARKIAEQVEAFSGEVSEVVGRLSTMTKRLAAAADQMIVAARHASDGSQQATGASANAAADVSSVATASEQLLDSIEEISRQVVQSTNVVKAAVERAGDTNAGMGRLSEAAQKVGDVVSLISRIAAQTNLLALNATIEAARAGEAGRGFAVVAQEVKVLATQTAKATQDITGQIADMQEATELSVEAIDKIQRKISEVEHISTIIAAAVHEQGAATQEIARNVRSAAAGTTSMSGHMEAVVRSVGETSTSAVSVSSLARELDEMAAGMTSMVERFSRTMKAA